GGGRDLGETAVHRPSGHRGGRQTRQGEHQHHGGEHRQRHPPGAVRAGRGGQAPCGLQRQGGASLRRGGGGSGGCHHRSSVSRQRSTAMTRRFSPSTGGRSSLVSREEMCFSTLPAETNRVSAIAWFERPCAISESTSRSRGVRVFSVRRRRERTKICWTTSGSSQVPPAPTSATTDRKSSTSATRSLST